MWRVSASFAVIAAVLFPTVAQAQPPGPVGVSRPVYSPYLNLVRRDAAPGINYYGLVRPQIAAQNNIQSLQQQITAGQRQQQSMSDPLANTGIPVTGQQVVFLNTGGYFLNNRSGGVPANPSLTTRSAGTPARPAGRR